MSEESEDRAEQESPIASSESAGPAAAGGIGARLPNLWFGARIGEFYRNVKLEMRKTSWPTRNEVWSTTVVVLIAVFFFGFYLWGVDRLITLGFEALEKVFK